MAANPAMHDEAMVRSEAMKPHEREALRAFGFKLCLGKKKLPTWTESLKTYLFWCGECGNFAIDYAHGQIGGT